MLDKLFVSIAPQKAGFRMLLCRLPFDCQEYPVTLLHRIAQPLVAINGEDIWKAAWKISVVVLGEPHWNS
jgi:hypothetical protein